MRFLIYAVSDIAAQAIVRLMLAFERSGPEPAYLTIKGMMRGVTRLELEYAIPVSEAATMLDCGGRRRVRMRPSAAVARARSV